MSRRQTSSRRLRVLIAPDKFKGTLTAAQASRAIAAGWRKARPQDEITLAPVSDGGDGFGPVLRDALDAKTLSIKTVNAAHQPVIARWWWVEDSKTAIIESANIIGLAMLPTGRHHPFELDTFGLGKVLRAAERKRAKKCLVGIGGSATNDGGFGMAKALGWSFRERDGSEIDAWPQLTRLVQILPPARRPFTGRLTVAVDVNNPLLGARGCSRIYGPQKGLRTKDMKPSEAALRRLAKVITDTVGTNVHKQPGAGAAGGMGFGLQVFAGAQAAPGFDLVTRQLRLQQKVRRSDLVITGEGSLDRSSLMGKGVGELIALSASHAVPVIGLAGQVGKLSRTACTLQRARGLVDITDSASAMTAPGRWLRELSRQTAASL